MNNAQWLEERRRGIGGSDIAAIMGISPWKSAYRVYQEKRREVEDWQGNALTDWGQRLEPMIRQWYSDETGRAVRVPEKILVSTKHPFLFASLDGFTDDNRVVEIKTARSGKDWGEPGTDEIPDYYALQVQHYLIVTGYEFCDVPVSIAGSPPELYEVTADKDIQGMIIEAAAKFWEQVQKGIPPEPASYADVVQRYGRSRAEGVVIADRETVAAIEKLRDVRAAQLDLKVQEEDLKGCIIKALSDLGDTLTDDGDNTLVTYKMAKGRKSFDAKAFQKDYPDMYEKYLTNGKGSRRFLLK